MNKYVARAVVAAMVVAGKSVEKEKGSGKAMKLGVLWEKVNVITGKVEEVYADNLLDWKNGATWEYEAKFITGDLAQCTQSHTAYKDFLAWYASTEFHDEESQHYKGWPFKKVGGANDKSCVVRDNHEDSYKWKFFATTAVKAIQPRSPKEDEEAGRKAARRKVHRNNKLRGEAASSDSSSDSD